MGIQLINQFIRTLHLDSSNSIKEIDVGTQHVKGNTYEQFDSSGQSSNPDSINAISRETTENLQHVRTTDPQ